MGSLTNDALVMNAFLEVAVGSWRVKTWSHQESRSLADRSVWDSVVSGLPLRLTSVTNSTIHTACAYEIDFDGRPSGDFFPLPLDSSSGDDDFSRSRRGDVSIETRFAGTSGGAIVRLEEIGFRYVNDRLCRTVSPYRDPEFDYPLVYFFEMLFEWFEGEEMFNPSDRIAPWI